MHRRITDVAPTLPERARAAVVQLSSRHASNNSISARSRRKPPARPNMSRDFDVVGGDAAARAAVEAAAPARRWHPVEAAGGLLTSAGCGLRVAPPCAQPSELLTLADGGTMRLTWCAARAHAGSAAPLTRERTHQVHCNRPGRATRRGDRHSRPRQHVALAIRAHRMRPPRAPRIPRCMRRPARIARHPAHLATHGRARRMARPPSHSR